MIPGLFCLCQPPFGDTLWPSWGLSRRRWRWAVEQNSCARQSPVPKEIRKEINPSSLDEEELSSWLSSQWIVTQVGLSNREQIKDGARQAQSHRPESDGEGYGNSQANRFGWARGLEERWCTKYLSIQSTQTHLNLMRKQWAKKPAPSGTHKLFTIRLVRC